MDRMKYNEWQKLPSGGIWQLDPSSMKFIGLKGTNMIAGSDGPAKTTPGSVGTAKMTPGSVTTIGGSVGTIKKSSELLVVSTL
jgi:hypothetical protein